MADNGFWQVFADTGDPMAWLMYKKAETKDNKDDGTEKTPQSLG